MASHAWEMAGLEKSDSNRSLHDRSGAPQCVCCCFLDGLTHCSRSPSDDDVSFFAHAVSLSLSDTHAAGARQLGQPAYSQKPESVQLRINEQQQITIPTLALTPTLTPTSATTQGSISNPNPNNANTLPQTQAHFPLFQPANQRGPSANQSGAALPIPLPFFASSQITTPRRYSGAPSQNAPLIYSTSLPISVALNAPTGPYDVDLESQNAFSRARHASLIGGPMGSQQLGDQSSYCVDVSSESDLPPGEF